jgi:hypothetical protein
LGWPRMVALEGKFDNNPFGIINRTSIMFDPMGPKYL